MTQRIVTTVVDTCFSHDEIALIVPRRQVAEFSGKVVTKHYVRERISHTTVDQFVAKLTVLAEQSPRIEDIATFSRYPKDDYLVAHSVVNEVDFLITGDEDLLVLSHIGELIILRPADFLSILQKHGFFP
jgi:predicted nucleic acid-binding protein